MKEKQIEASMKQETIRRQSMTVNELFDAIVDIQPTVEPKETKPCAKNCVNCGQAIDWSAEK